MRLHITNGDIVAETIASSRLGGEVLPWRDVLHEGPVPGGLSLEELSEVRARFLGGLPWGPSIERVREQFRSRDEGLRRFRRFAEVLLWFEHDLFDQLQLVQLLHWFGQRDLGTVRLKLICIGEFPGIEPFHGLGQLDARQLEALEADRDDVQKGELELAVEAWEAFCSDNPRKLEALLGDDLTSLPFLREAILRHLEQYPAVEDGLSRSERQLLQTLDRGPHKLGELFRASQIDAEKRPFMGDHSFLGHVMPLCEGAAPLLERGDGRPFAVAGPPDDEPGFWDRELTITSAGRRVLAGEADRVHLLGIDRWLGGVHLAGRTPRWRWNPRKKGLTTRGD